MARPASKAKAKGARANYLPAPHYFNLNMACLSLAEAFGHCIYLVGSSTERADYRDVDVRCILDDDAFDKLFPGLGVDAKTSLMQLDAKWSVICSSISLYLSQHSGLPVDFQIQQQSAASATFSIRKGHRRHPIGIFINRVRK